MSLQDQHLQQAIKSAPDRDMVPNDATRAAVLAYAKNAVKSRQDTWWKRFSELMHQWLGFNLHSVGLGSAVATVLVVVIFWHEQPDDTMWRAAAPSEERQIGDSVKESSMQSAPEATLAERALDLMPSDAVTPAQKTGANSSEKKVVINKPLGETAHDEPSKESSSKTKSTAPATNTEDAELKSSGLAEAIPQAAPAAIEPDIPASIAVAQAPALEAQDKVARAPASMASKNDVATTKGELAKALEAESDTSLKVGREDIVAKKSAARADTLGASVPKAAAKPQGNQTLLSLLKNEGGMALANQDIQAGKLRLLKLEVQSKDFDALNCPQLIDQAIVVDARTGYKIESVGSCDATASLLKEVEVYNQTMRDWHSNHLSKF